MQRYITFQPNSVCNVLRKRETYAPKTNYCEVYNVFDYNPIFALRCDSIRQVLTDFLATYTTFPQSIIVFESNKAVPINKLGWLKYIQTGNKNYIWSGGHTEFVVREIKPSSVLRIIEVSKSEDSSEVQDDLLDFFSSAKAQQLGTVIESMHRERVRLNFDKPSREVQVSFMETTLTLNQDAICLSECDMDYLYDEIIPHFIQHDCMAGKFLTTEFNK